MRGWNRTCELPPPGRLIDQQVRIKVFYLKSFLLFNILEDIPHLIMSWIKNLIDCIHANGFL